MQMGLPEKSSWVGGILRKALWLAVFIAVLCFSGTRLIAADCAVVKHLPPSEADTALLGADYAKAAGLYQAVLTSHPGDADATIGLVHALLHQQKLSEAEDAVDASLAASPKSAALLTLRGEVEFRQGTPWFADQTARESDTIDPCNPRTHLLLADLERLSSMYASSRKDLHLAHQIDPADPQIRAEWIRTLSLKRRIAETEAYLSAATGDDEDDIRHWRLYLEGLKKLEDEPHKACHLVSPAAATEIPFVAVKQGGLHSSPSGIEVKLNDETVTLKVDTGASGLVLSRSAAKHAGLKPFSPTEMSGIGDKGYKPGYSAFADSIHIGNLEFQDCPVNVLDSRSGLDGIDGLIGMNVFSQFLVTLDFPMQKLLLGPLPPRPGETSAIPVLKTSSAERDDSEPPSETAKAAQQESKDAQPDKPVEGGTEPGGTAVSAAPQPPGSAANKPGGHGPYDRYIAPEMQSYTPVYRNGNDLILPTKLNGQKLKLFILDTGAWTTIISPQAAKDLTAIHPEDRLYVKGINGKVDKVYSADQLTLEFAHVSETAYGVVALDTARMSKGLGMEITGLIGANTLDQFIVHIDYRDGLVKFDSDPKHGDK
jgi:predicted aspartyl protease